MKNPISRFWWTCPLWTHKATGKDGVVHHIVDPRMRAAYAGFAAIMVWTVVSGLLFLKPNPDYGKTKQPVAVVQPAK